MAGLRPTWSTIRPAGHSAAACVSDPTRNPMPTQKAVRPRTSATNSGMSEERMPKSTQPLPRLVTSAARYAGSAKAAETAARRHARRWRRAAPPHPVGLSP